MAICEVYGTAEDEQGVGSAMTRQRRGFGGWRGAGELCWWMQDRMMSVGGDRCWERAFFWIRVFPFLSWFSHGPSSRGGLRIFQFMPENGTSYGRQTVLGRPSR